MLQWGTGPFCTLGVKMPPASSVITSEAISPVLGSGEMIVEGLFDTVGGSPGGVGKVSATLLMLL